MSARFFLDTNVLVYAADARAGEKQRRAQGVISDCREASSGVISTQVLVEFYSIITRKVGVDPLVARDMVTDLRDFEVVIMDMPLIREGIDISLLSRLSFWDGMIVAAAEWAGCQVVVTEDLNHGQVISGVRIENPFLDLGKPPKKTTRERRVGYRTKRKKKA